ncbi:hypothetical protein DPEC_G00166380 [Dallia pectoralis]|uniref:Uncharacterized protein n=1 Tax=Dallia pectoralis TaxID=75939 RepID=A0ACC2GHB6_DALPE|nr:hypothetical protein DPEC_G00166380 [Dallia pectoralis]
MKADPLKNVGTSPGFTRRATQENRRSSEPLEPQQQLNQQGRRQSSTISSTQAPKQESGGFLGFGGPKSQPATSKPEESVSGKMFGFGSSIFSSASTLITSAVQDQPRTTPPASPKMSAGAHASPKIPPAKETKPPAARKVEEMVAEKPQQSNVPPTVQAKVDKLPSEPSNGAASSQPVPKANQSTCPLCKVELNMGSKDPPNYNTCTECKNMVCNLCGFNPMPHETLVEWLCLNCQMQRALGGGPSTMPPNKVSASEKLTPTPSTDKKDIATVAASAKKDSPAPSNPVTSPFKVSNAEAAKAADTKILASPSPAKTAPLESESQKLQQQPSPGRRQSSDIPATKQESGGLFGFGTPKSLSTTSKTEESASGKMFGFGSSIFSSASTLITSTVHDEPIHKTPTSPKVSAPVLPQQKEATKTDGPPKLVTIPVSPQKYPETVASMKAETVSTGTSQEHQASPAMASQQHQKPVENVFSSQPPQPPVVAPKAELAKPQEKLSKGVTSPAKSLPPQQAQPPKQSGGLFGFGVPKSQPAPSKPEESVSGKMFGFGSSIFSSASTLITSAVQDEHRTTPPASPKVSAAAHASPKIPPAKETKPPAARKVEEKVAEKPQQSNVPPTVQAKVDKLPSEPSKGAASSQPVPKANQSTCPLCKVELNMGSKDPPNYNTCTECKNMVCNLCGFNPMPHETEVKEWLCLNCQMQRALGKMEPPGHSVMKLSPKKESTPQPLVVKPAAFAKNDIQVPDHSQSKPLEVKAVNELATQKLANTEAHQKKTPEHQRTSEPQKPQQSSGPGHKQSNTNLFTQQTPKLESGGLFRGPKSQPATSKAEESMSGKMFGFGSSIFSSASTLITSAVQDGQRTTPPASPKVTKSAQASPKILSAKETKQPTEAEKKPPEQLQSATFSPLQDKVETVPSVPPKGSSQPVPKSSQSTCPLCKVELNMGSKDPPNYNTCTECKNTVCNLCGFNPMPHETKLKEWLCLNCQMHRTHNIMELPEPSKMKYKAPVNKDSMPDTLQKYTPTYAAPQKDTHTPQKDKSLPVSSKIVSQSKNDPTPGDVKMTDLLVKDISATPLSKEETTAAIPLIKETPTSASPFVNEATPASAFLKDEPSRMSALAKEELTSILPLMKKEPTHSSSLIKEEPAPASPLIQGTLTSASAFIKEASPTGLPLPKDPSIPISKVAVASGPVSSEKKEPLLSASTHRKEVSTSDLTEDREAVQSEECLQQKEAQSLAALETKEGTPLASTPSKQCPIPHSPRTKEATEVITPLENISLDKQKPGVFQQSVEQPARPTTKQKKSVQQLEDPKKQMPVHQHLLTEALPQVQIQKSPKTDTNITPPKQESEKIASPTIATKSPQNRRSSVPHSPPQQPNQSGRRQSSAIPTTEQTSKQQSGGLFGFGTPKPLSTPLKLEDSVSGKMFGFGSSILSSASTLINSAVQEKASTTPPASPKVSAANKDSSTISSATETKPPPVQKADKNVEKQQAKVIASVEAKDTQPSELQKGAVPSQPASKSNQSLCPLCKVEFNIGSKEPQNYNTCTECKQTVCNLCGFNPMPNVTEMQRALGVESSDPTMIKLLPSKVSTQAHPENEAPTPALLIKEPGYEPVLQKTSESVSGKMLGFGSSIFSSASTVTTQLFKMSTSSHHQHPPRSDKNVEKQQAKVIASVEAKDTQPSELQKGAVPSQPASKSNQSLCPLCKVEFNIGSKEPQNYNTCTECKQTVCNLCGFNPMPNVTEMQRALGVESSDPTMIKLLPSKVSTQAHPENEAPTPALLIKEPGYEPVLQKTSESVSGKMLGFGSSIFSSASTVTTTAVQDEHLVTPPASPKVPSFKAPQQEEMPKPNSPQKVATKMTSPKIEPVIMPSIKDNTAAPGLPPRGVPSAVASQKDQYSVDKPTTTPAQSPLQQKTLEQGKPLQPPAVAPNVKPGIPQQQLSKGGTSPAKAVPPPHAQPPKQESGGFFGFGGPKSQPASSKPEESVSGKMFGFGSSIFSSASTLITSAVQDQPRTTPPASPKVSARAKISPKVPPAKETKLPSDQKAENKADQPQQAKVPQSVQAKVDKLPSTASVGPAHEKTPVNSQQAAPTTTTTKMETVKPESLKENTAPSQNKDVSLAPRTTPPASPKMSAGAQASPKILPAMKTKPPAAQKVEEKKAEQPQETKPTSSVQGKMEKVPSESQKGDASFQPVPKVASPQSFHKASQSTCPLCKVELNMGSKDPPNYNTCTECKNMVCNLCGFNPMPHETETEWLCLNCQTQKALSGHLGEIEKMVQPKPIQPKPLIAITSTKLNKVPTTATTVTEILPKTQPPCESVPLTPEPTLKHALAQNKLVSNMEVSKVEGPKVAAKAEPSKMEAPKMEIAKTEAAKMEAAESNVPKTELPKPGQYKLKQPDTEAASVTTPLAAVQVTEAAAVTPSTVKENSEVKVQTAELPKPAELLKPAEGNVGKEVQGKVNNNEEGKVEKATKKVDKEAEEGTKKVASQPAPTAATVKEVATPLVETIDYGHSDPQLILTEMAVKEKIKEQTAASFVADQVVVDIPSTPVIPSEGDTKTEDHSDKSLDGPDILPISQGSYTSEEDLKEVQRLRDVLMMDITPDTAMPAKEEVNGEKRRLSYVTMEESSGSEPSPSPQFQRRKLSAVAVSTAASSSSEDYKADSPTESPLDSPDSFVDEEEFIRRQIMGMTGEEGMSVSEEEEKTEKEIKEMDSKESELAYASAKAVPLLKKDSMNNEDSTGRIPSLPGSELKSTVGSTDLTEHTTVYKKAVPMMRQGTKSTDGDAEVESVTDSLEDRSKGEGSSSVQVSSFTPGTSPTSASSLEEDSDSSPTHKRSGEWKHHRKAKHRQAGQPIYTVEDSSEDEEFREEDDHTREKDKQKELDQHQVKRSSKKSKRDKDELRAQRRRDHPLTSPSNLSPIEDASPTEEVKQAKVLEAIHRTSCSDYSPSMESDFDAFHTEARIAVPCSTQRPLKSAEEVYEEMLQKARSPKSETVPVPEIEPLYDGMAIEDYLYESLVEEPEAIYSPAQFEQRHKDPAEEPGKICLRSPEEVYEEMMQKKKELMLIEQEFKKAMDNGNPEIHVTAPSSAAAESCKVGEAEGEKPMLDADSTYVKRKKRPAPPRPSEPPKRPGLDTAKPKVLQDTMLRRALYPIPDLKITQCSSGEDETDDSVIEEYGVGVSSDITPSDESETKEVEYSPISQRVPIIETADVEPITVLSEVLLEKACPTTASAPATVYSPSMTTTPSPVSPVSPPTSPATPVTSPPSNATSSSSFQARSPPSSDSTPVSTPTTDLAEAAAPFGAQSAADISPPSITPIMVVSPTTVLVTVLDVITDLTPATPATTATDTTYSEIQAKAHAPGMVQISDPVVIQMPDMVISQSHISVQCPPSVQVIAPTPVPSPVASQLPSPVAPSAVPTQPQVSVPITAPASVVVQMPDLVTTTSIASHQVPTVEHSVPVQATAPSSTPIVVPASGTRRIQRQASTKKKPPPPPPRSTSVSLPQTSAEPTSIRAIQHVSPTMTTTTAIGTGQQGQTIESVVVDIQPWVEQVCPGGGPAPQVMMTSTRHGHVFSEVSNVENVSMISQTSQDLAATSVASTLTSAVVKGRSQMVDGHVVVSVAPFPIVSSIPAVLSSDKCKPEADTTPHTPHPPPPVTLTKPAVYPKKPSVSILPSVPTAVTVSTAVTMAQATVTGTGRSPVHKSSAPPPVPPKPVSIPAGLVFSHRPGESVKPPVVPTASHTLPRTREVHPNDSVLQPFTATTLPRTREPPNALSLSLTTPVETKMSATSPRSPMSPRYAKCLETYVVITLPSEPSTPTEGITVQAPIRRGSIPSAKQTGPEVRTTPSEQRSPIEAFSALATVRTASFPSIRQPPPTAATVPAEGPVPLEAVTVIATARLPSMLSAMPLPKAVAEVVTVSAGSEIPIQETSQAITDAPVTITRKFHQESVESQEICGPEKMVSSLSHVYSTSISTSGQPPESLPSLVTQVVTTEVQRTTVSVVHERLSQIAASNAVAITIQPDLTKIQPSLKQNGKTFSGDAIDLALLK